MEWRDEGALIAVRRHGENAAIIEVFTAGHGRHAGVVRGGAGRRMSPILQPGAQLDVTWRARLEDHLGSFTVEPLASRAAILGDRLALAGLNATTALLAFCLPEREPHPQLYLRSMALMDAMVAGQGWPAQYLLWELALLDEMGFGLDLERCAVTGSREDLAYVSPRSGRAVSKAGAGDWAGRLLPLPAGMRGAGPLTPDDIVAGLITTGHFLQTWLAPQLGDRRLPEARQRLIDRLASQFARKTSSSPDAP